MCCYKDYKNFERLNNLVQLVLHRAIGFIESLPRDCQTSSHNEGSVVSADEAVCVGAVLPMTRDDDVDVDVMSVNTDGTDLKKMPEDEISLQSIPVSVAELTDEASAADHSREPHTEASESTGDNESGNAEDWSLDEKEKLFQFIGKVFTPSFPLYFAYKHCIHSSLEDLSKQDACALNNYCELSVSASLCSFLCLR